MRSIIGGTAALVFLSLAGLGCQDKVYNENLAMRKQNAELQRELDDARSRQQTPVLAASPQPVIIAPSPAPAPVAPAPAPAPAAPAAPAPAPQPDLGPLEVTRDAAAGTTTVNLPSDVFFASGQAVLLPEAKHSLTKVVVALKKDYASKPVRIEGNTDSDPIRKSHWSSNQELSEKRAEAVRDYLVSKGIPVSRITTEGLGDTNPKSQTDKAKNRRVELVVLTG